MAEGSVRVGFQNIKARETVSPYTYMIPVLVEIDMIWTLLYHLTNYTSRPYQQQIICRLESEISQCIFQSRAIDLLLYFQKSTDAYVTLAVYVSCRGSHKARPTPKKAASDEAYHPPRKQGVQRSQVLQPSPSLRHLMMPKTRSKGKYFTGFFYTRWLDLDWQFDSFLKGHRLDVAERSLQETHWIEILDSEMTRQTYACTLLCHSHSRAQSLSADHNAWYSAVLLSVGSICRYSHPDFALGFVLHTICYCFVAFHSQKLLSRLC